MLVLFASRATGGEAFNTVRVTFGNEQHPTADAGVGPGMDVVREGDCLYMLQDRNLVILSVKNPAQPVVTGKLEDVGNLRQIAIRGNVAFITAREDGLFVVDVSDRTAPKVVSHYDTLEFATGIAIEGQYAFIAQRWFGVEIVDIGDPARVRHVSVVRVGESQSCVVSEGYLYVGAWDEKRVAVCDVRNPAAPKQVAMIQLHGRGDGLCVEQGVLYAAFGHHQPGASQSLDDPRYGNGNGLDLFDVSDPTNPKQLSRVQFAWRYYYGWPDTWRVKLSFPYAYLYHTHNGVFILDVSDPKSPKELAQIRVPRYPGQPGFQKLSTADKSGQRPIVLPFDPAKVCYSPVCGLETVDGYLYFTGLFTDLHVYHNEALVKAIPQRNRGRIELSAKGDFHDFKAQAKDDLKGLKTYRPGGQVYAAVEQNGLIYAACGMEGIQVLDKDLTLLRKYPTAGFAMDVQVYGAKLYAAQGLDGLVCYQVDGASLVRVAAYDVDRVIKQVRVTPDGRFAAAHVGGSTYEIIDVSSPDKFKRVQLVRGWGGLAYYRQLCNGFIDGRYLCGTWCGGRTFLMDFGGAKPEELPDPTGFLPDMEAGGYCACGPYALLTRDGGYSYYKPCQDGNYPAKLAVSRIEGGPAFRGKPAVRGNILAACDRIEGDVTLVDISNLEAPKLIRQFRVSGNPDVPFVGDGLVLIPAGYQGLIRIDL